MVKRRIQSLESLKNPLRFWLLMGATSVALAGVVVTISTRTVFANALLPRPAATASSAVPASSATPALLAPQSVNAAMEKQLHGVASWYGKRFQGRRTASGERFNMYALTACHPTLPFGSIVRVFNRDNQLSVVVRITDRGDLVEGRILDLSLAAADKLKMTKAGLAQVDLQVLTLGNGAYQRESEDSPN